MPPLSQILGRLGGLGLLLLAACSDSGGPLTAPANAVLANNEQGLVVVVQPDEQEERPGFFDFGVVENGQSPQHTFVLQNKDPRPVTIQKVDPGCGCTVARIMRVEENGDRTGPTGKNPLELLILEPGQQAEIELRVDTTKVKVKNTNKLFMVRISTNSVEKPYLTLECHLIVDMPWQVAPKSVNLQQIPTGAGATGIVTIKALGQAGMTLGEILETPPGTTATLQEQPFYSEAVWTLEAGFLPPVDLGLQAFEVSIETIKEDGTKGEPLQVRVSGTATPDVSFVPQRLMLRPNPKGVGVKTDEGLGLAIGKLRTLLSGHTFRVIGFRITGDHADELEFDATPVRPNANGASKEWDLSLTAKNNLSASQFTGTIEIELDDPQYKNLELPYVGLGFPK